VQLNVDGVREGKNCEQPGYFIYGNSRLLLLFIYESFRDFCINYGMILLYQPWCDTMLVNVIYSRVSATRDSTTRLGSLVGGLFPHECEDGNVNSFIHSIAAVHESFIHSCC